jgi:hypothetical protein
MPGVQLALVCARAQLYLYALPTTPPFGLLSPAWKT